MSEFEQMQEDYLSPYQELFERSADAILIIEGSRFVDCNAAAVRMLRYQEKREVLESHPSDLSPPKQPDGKTSFAKANEMIRIAFRKGSHRFEWNHKRSDGEVFPVEVLLTAIQKSGKSTLHVVWRDITERKRLEAELRQSQKMDALGQLAGGIAHDFNNMLVVILGHCELLGLKLKNDPRASGHLSAIEDAGERAAGIIRQLLAFGRKQKLQPKIIDLNQLLSELPALLRPLIGDDIELDIQTSPGQLLVKSDQDQLEQVILNLMTNARDAMTKGGTITLTTSQLSVTENNPSPMAGLDLGEYAVITIVDQGHGLDCSILDKVFEPFFTTKRIGKGSGLGLATVYGIIQQNGGAIAIRNGETVGAVVNVYLPRTAEPQRPSEIIDKYAIPEKTGQTILVVEDDVSVSQLISSALHAHGFEVMVAKNGAQAMEAYRLNNERIALIVSDVLMPVMGGPEFVGNLQDEGFSPAVLFVSGHVGDALEKIDQLNIQAPLLEKPFDVRSLLQSVHGALNLGIQ